MSYEFDVFVSYAHLDDTAIGGDQKGWVAKLHENLAQRLAELLGVTKQGASRLADDMVTLGYLERNEDPADRRRTCLRLSPAGERIRARALAESHAIEDELRQRFGDTKVRHFRDLLTDFIEHHGGADELAAQRSRAPDEPA